MRNMLVAAVIAAGTIAVSSSPALALFEGFEDPSWEAGAIWKNYLGGDVEQVGSGDGGITSSTGDYHAIVTNLQLSNDVFNNPSLGASGPYASLGSYGSTFGQGYVVRQDFYLDTGWADNSGFDFGVAVNKPDGNHRRDFIWHVGVLEGDLLINVSHNSDRRFNAAKLQREDLYFTVAAEGWYTFETVFYDNGDGVLAVDFNLLNSGGASLHSLSLSNTDDTIDVQVGGPRIGWLIYNNIDGLALDNTSVVPEPAALSLLGLGGLALLRRRRIA